MVFLKLIRTRAQVVLQRSELPSPVLQAIVNRGINQQALNTAIDRQTLQIVLDSGLRLASPRSRNNLWSYVVIQDECYIQYLREYALLIEKMDLARVASKDFPRRDVSQSKGSIVAVCANLTTPFSADDCWLSVENMLLTSSALGYSALLDGSMLKVLNLSNIKSDLDVPDELTTLAAIEIGLSDGAYLPKKIAEPKIWKWIVAAN